MRTGFHQISQFRAYVQVRVFSEERQSCNPAVGDRYFFHLIKSHDVPESGILERQFQ
jgi:hypothetical protein